MSFRLFIYYCALCGAGAALVGWALGRWRPLLSVLGLNLSRDGERALWLGLTVALALILVDTLWNVSFSRAGTVVARVLLAGLIGGVGGLFGGFVGQALFGWFNGNEGMRVFGWALTGALVGAALGVFEWLEAKAHGQDRRGAVRKIRNGLIGGGAGGLLGGLLYVMLAGALKGLLQDKPDEKVMSPSAWGFAALGACIGLLIGLAQIILKEAWLKIESGPRAGREQLLSRPVLTIGRAESCDVGLFGDPTVEKMHARIDRQGDDYVLCDAGSAAGTYVNDERLTAPRVLCSGDAIRIGRWVLRFGERTKRPAGR
jgi:hypothetical protein